MEEDKKSWGTNSPTILSKLKTTNSIVTVLGIEEESGNIIAETSDGVEITDKRENFTITEEEIVKLRIL